jgi:hypothetical protein
MGGLGPDRRPKLEPGGLADLDAADAGHVRLDGLEPAVGGPEGAAGLAHDGAAAVAATGEEVADELKQRLRERLRAAAFLHRSAHCPTLRPHEA